MYIVYTLSDDMPEQQQINFNPSIKPIFADEVAIALKINAAKDENGNIHKDSQIEIIFIDVMTHQAVGAFVITRNTAKSVLKILGQNIEALDKELKSKEMPKQPEIKTTGDVFSGIR